ncbi:L-idonate 5-dehydrogenase [Streptomyces marispadix]|uniref:L-idonate 5-dehydrogenase n=1 Tax=Streptomyces marispadix TaxID=2922868 RepID=A0ABS9T5F6_9ACTN|nr:L-idonate 5-dehydrogenase [Streptomyces marispadix]MCH6163740.1 L-idonate 5-dehydrogenase [Streptomyces marispadix]
MRAVVVHGAGDLRVEERAAPRPRPGEVLVAMTHGGVCGSDLHYYREGAVGSFAVREPLTLGHEVVGRVAEDPTGTLPPGTPVAVHPGTSCGSCRECRKGHPQVCRDARYLGSAATFPHTQGGFTGRLAVPAGRLRTLPPRLPLSRAVLAEPLAVALHALRRAGGVTGARVLVNGAGPIGALTAGAARAGGAEEVWAGDVLEPQLHIAELAGAHTTVRIGRDTLPPEHFDVVIEASGAPAAPATVMDAVARRGVIVQLGSPPAEPVRIPFAPLVAKEIAVRGTFRFEGELGAAVAMLASSDHLESVVTRTFPLEEAVEAMRTAADPAVPGKVVLLLDEETGTDSGPGDTAVASASATSDSPSTARPSTATTRPRTEVTTASPGSTTGITRRAAP